MALFKIFRGPSERLKDVKPTEGYAYFTPDDGKFYIDIKTDDKEPAVVGSTSASGANRICINSGISLFNNLILDCGTANGWVQTTITYFECGDSDLSDELDALFYDNGDSDLLDEQEVVFYDSGDSFYNI